MLKAIERMHVRSQFIQIGASCMGQQLAACYRTLKDEETGLTFCMIMCWNGSTGTPVDFRVQATDELMHLWFEDNGCDWERERELDNNGDLDLPEKIMQSDVYQKVSKQLQNAIIKKLDKLGYQTDENWIVTAKEA